MALRLQPGDQAPDFELPGTLGVVRLSELTRKGKTLVAFYTEDATPLCATQLTSFKDEFETFTELGVQVIAISADDLDSHWRFAKILGGLPFPLASDGSLEAARRYGVVDDSGRRSRRAVFVVGEDGKLLHANIFYNPGNPSQYAEIFTAVGLEM